MNIRSASAPPASGMIPALVLLVCVSAASAYPPAPFHRVFGILRDDHGNPLGAGDAVVVLSDGAAREIVRAPSDPGTGLGVNYSLSVPMDTGLTDQLYTASALRPAYPFTIRVIRGGAGFVPLEMRGAAWKIGDPAGGTRIDLTLGIDSDSDGLPDAWEEELIRSSGGRGPRNIAGIRPDDDIDGDGLTNLQEYIAGTYASDSSDGLFLEILSVSNGLARVRFLAVEKRTYRLKSSSDLTTFTDQSFALSAAAGSNLIPGFTAGETKYLDAWVPVGDASKKTFRLYVE